MRIVRLILALLALTVIPHSLYAVCHCITPSGTGNGSDWNNAAGWNTSTFPLTITPGDTYYIAGGDYTATAGTSISSSNSAVTTFITKATQSAHCTDAGWNNATMGTPIAVWQLNATQATPYIQFPVGGFAFDGVTGDGTPNTSGQYGFYFNYTGSNLTTPVITNVIVVGSISSTQNVLNMTLSHYEINEGNAMAIPYASGPGAGVPITIAGGSGFTVSNVALSYFYQHDGEFVINGFNVNGITIHHGWFARNRYGGAHSDGITFKSNPNPGESADNVTIYDTVFEDIEGTGTIVALWGHGDIWNIYNNVFFSTGQPIQLASIARSGGVVTATTQTPVPQGAGPSQWLTSSWFKVTYTTLTTKCASSDTTAPKFDCFNGTFQPATISGDGKTLTWNQTLCQVDGNGGAFVTCPNETGAASTGDIELHGQHGVTYVTGENGGGLTDLNFANNTISNVSGLPGVGCRTYVSGYSSGCNLQNNIWWTSADPTVATAPGTAGIPAPHIAVPNGVTGTPCTGPGTPNPNCTSGSGNLVGAYQWQVTASYAGGYGQGNETPGAPGASVIATNQQVYVDWNSAAVKFYNVYRTLAGGLIYYLVGQVTETGFPVSQGTRFLDNVSDITLATSPCAATPAPPCGPLSPPTTNTTPGLGTHNYNSLLNTQFANAGSVTLGSNDYQFSSGIADPFVNDASKNFHLLTDTTQSGGLSYLLGTASGNPSGDSSDFDGTGRPGVNGWDRGAFQFAGTRPAPPTNLQVVSVQ